MAGAGKKTFTAGEVLTASDVNTYLMEQSVMVFGGTAARSSAIPTPSTGMVSYIGTTGTATIPQIEAYTGSAWQTPYGMTLITKVDFSAQTSVAIDNVFTTSYDYYVIEFSGVASGATGIRFVYRTGGTPADVTTGYNGGLIYTNAGSGPTRSSNIASGYSAVGAVGTTGTALNINIYDVALAKPTNNVYTSFAQFAAELEPSFGGCVNTNATAYAGIRFYPTSGNFTGTFRIYGKRNA